MNTKLNSFFTVSACAVALLASAALFAQTPSDTDKAQPAKVVRYSDLDLSSSVGIHTLYQRIQDAAWRVCLDVVPPHNGQGGIENIKCRQTLIDVAVAQVNKPALTALHAGKSSDSRTARR